MSTKYIECLANQSPFTIGVDENDRIMWSVNFRLLSATPVDDMEGEIVKFIEDNSLGVRMTDLFYGQQVDIPSGAGPYVLLVNSGGTATDITHDGYRGERLSFQVLVYAGDYSEGQQRVYGIWRLLDGKRDFTLTA